MCESRKLVFLQYAFVYGGNKAQALLDCIPRLPQGLQAEVLKYKRTHDRLLSTAGKVLLMNTFKTADLPVHWIHQISYSRYKRPVLDDTLDFNISHSGNCVVCAVGKGTKVGIDIEERRKICIEDLLPALRDDEYRQVEEKGATPDSLLRFWTKKEAVLKASGEGLLMQPQQIFFNDDNTATCKGDCWYLQQLPIHDNYICSLATDTVSPDIHIMRLDNIADHLNRL